MEHSTLDGFVFDLDGTVYSGERALLATVETITHLREHAKHVLFVSSKPLQPCTAHAEKLTRMGIPARADDVIPLGMCSATTCRDIFQN